MQAVFGLIPDHGGRPLHNGVGDFLAAVGGQAVQDLAAGGGHIQQGLIDLKTDKDLGPGGLLRLLAHAYQNHLRVEAAKTFLAKGMPAGYAVLGGGLARRL